MKIRPLDESLLGQAGVINQTLGRHERAKIYYNRIPAKNPRHTSVFINTGVIELMEILTESE